MALTDNLVSYYKCDTNGSFPDALDNNNGSLNGPTYTASGKINGAYELDGNNDYISFASSSTGWIFTDGGSFSFWVYLDASSSVEEDFLYFRRGAVGGDPYILVRRNADGSILFRFRGTGGSSKAVTVTEASGDVTEGEWVHYVLSYDGSELTVYKNNSSIGTDSDVAVGTIDFDTFTTDSDNGLRFGTSPAGVNPADGKIDEIGIWTRDLSSAEVSELYNSGNGLQYPFTSGWTGTVCTVLNPAKINGIEVANISKVSGVE